MRVKSHIKSLLSQLYSKKISVNQAFEKLKTLPYENLGFAKLDHHRFLRKGFGEVVFCQGKKREEVKKILDVMIAQKGPLILTRADSRLYRYLKRYHHSLKYNNSARIIYLNKLKPKSSKKVLIITAGTSDIPVAEEAKLTLEIMGNRVKVIYDVGVAGLHRLLDNMSEISKANVIIVIAGMEGALGSVIGGLTDKPVIAVPTSVGYGAGFKGIAPLLTMLNSCSPGVAVMNIDNGFGAGYFASMINK